jgi:MFS family permease
MMMYTAIFSFGNSLLRPSISTLISKEAGGSQGAAIGKMQSFDSLGRIIGPVLGGVFYDISYNLPNILGAAILLSIYVLAKSHLNKYAEGRLS